MSSARSLPDVARLAAQALERYAEEARWVLACVESGDSPDHAAAYARRGLACMELTAVSARIDDGSRWRQRRSALRGGLAGPLECEAWAAELYAMAAEHDGPRDTEASSG